MAESARSGRAPGYGVTLAVGLGAATALALAVSRPWIEASARHQSGVPSIETSASGADLAPLTGALGVVVLAAFGAVVATRGAIRRLLGILIVIASVVIVLAASHPDSASAQLEAGLAAKGWSGGAYTTDDRAWRWVALGGAVVCAVAGGLVGWRGGRWATMGTRYDAPSTSGEPPGNDVAAEPGDMREADVWREIDQGHDPTQTT